LLASNPKTNNHSSKKIKKKRLGHPTPSSGSVNVGSDGNLHQYSSCKTKKRTKKLDSDVHNDIPTIIGEGSGEMESGMESRMESRTKFGIEIIPKTEAEGMVAPKPQPPQDAQGSAWNIGSWHFEEQDFTKWGELRLKELLNQVPANLLSMDFEGSPAELSHSVNLKEMGGSAWTHIRKGKKIVGYDFELGLRWEGDLMQHGMLVWTLGGQVEYELTVDEDTPLLTFTPDVPTPWTEQIQQEITRVLHRQCQLFVEELQLQGGGQGWTAPTEPRVQVGQYIHHEG